LNKLKIQIIGLGVVGSAQAYLSRQLGHEVFGYDKNPEVYDKVKGLVDDINPVNEPKKDVDITFITTPDSEVEKTVHWLLENKVKGIYVIKSTVPVGETLNMMKKYNVNLSFNPEFLRKNYAIEDVMNPSRIVIGECCKDHGDILEEFYKPLNKPIYRTDPTTAEIIKLVSNSLRSVMISFWNAVYLLSIKTGANINIIAEAADPAKVIGEWEGGKWGTRFFGKPYGGKCLPKDTKHLINSLKKYDIDPSPLEATEKINEFIKKLNDKNK
jgi:nucleotide sugar dehydrogenase